MLRESLEPREGQQGPRESLPLEPSAEGHGQEMAPFRHVPLALVIDDSTDIHKLLSARLASERVTLRSALSADEGVALARELLPDVILLDVEMPDRSGFSVCRELKADPLTGSAPVLFLTAKTGLGDKVKGLDLGAMDYITKPFDVAELRARLRSALRVKRTQDMLAHRAQVDALTGLWTRSFFERRLREEVANFARHRHPFAVALVDIDRLGWHNEVCGYPLGDVIVQSVGELLSAVVRDTDIVCRHGGGTFSILLRQSLSAGGAAMAARLHGRIGALPVPRGKIGAQVSVSVGIAGTDLLGAALIGAKDVLAAVERALRRAKREGGARTIVATASCRDAPAPGEPRPGR